MTPIELFRVVFLVSNWNLNLLIQAHPTITYLIPAISRNRKSRQILSSL